MEQSLEKFMAKGLLYTAEILVTSNSEVVGSSVIPVAINKMSN